MIRVLHASLKYVLRTLGYGSIGALVIAIAGFVMLLENRPDLSVWHQAELDEEFTADSSVGSFEEYLALEKRLFEQLDELVYDKVEGEVESDDRTSINRYVRWSLSDPGRWRRNWNHSFELPSESPGYGALLLHGMSDSPYSLRSLAESLQDDGAWVVGLRIPGHGTAPSGLVHVEWEDMAAAVELGMRRVRDRIGDKPLFIVGYSNGGALAVQHVLAALEDESLTRSQGLVLISPEIGISKLAVFAVWQERLGHLLGFEKLAWNSIKPEYDPYKYGSFALNAGKQAYYLTEEIQAQITKLAAGGALEQLPPILAFQSAVDATVSASVLVSGLFDRLPRGNHELVIFDYNRFSEIGPIMKQDPAAWLNELRDNPKRPFNLTFVTNKTPQHRGVVAHHRSAGKSEVTTSKLGLIWPLHLYSLSHVALPFAPEDPVYGGGSAKESPGIKLGGLALRGENGALRISASDMLRLRWNPFHSYLVQRLLTFVGPKGPGSN